MRKKQYIIVGMIAMAALALNGCGEKKSPVETQETTMLETTLEETTVETTKETTEETTEETTKSESGEAKTIGTLSDDIYSFQLQLDGEVYQFPMKYSDFVAGGWVYDGDDTETLDSGYRASTQVFDKGKLEIYMDILNFDINARPLSECYLGGMSIDHWQLNKAGVSAVLPKGIALDVSSEADIRSAYGTPTYDNTTSSGMVVLEYGKDSYEKVKLTVSADTKKLSNIQIQNFVVPDDFAAGEVHEEVPEIVGKYKTPEAVSDEFGDFIVNYDDAIYQLPAPVSVFEANGWTVVEDKTQMQVAGRDFGWVTLSKDNQTLKVIANNYSEQATSMRNCFVTRIKSDDSSVKLPLTIAKGITVGMSQVNLEAALTGTDYEKEDSSDLYACYSVAPGKVSLDRYEIYVHKADSTVYKIEAANSPKFDAFTK